MKKILLRVVVIIFSFVLVQGYCLCQTDTTDQWKLYRPIQLNVNTQLQSALKDTIAAHKPGYKEVVANSKIAALVSTHTAINDSLKEISGYRVQIFTSSGVSSKAKAEETKASFINAFPGEVVKLDFVSPNYKVRAGAFRSKLEALGFQQKISAIFPETYVIEDSISLDELTQ